MNAINNLVDTFTQLGADIKHIANQSERLNQNHQLLKGIQQQLTALASNVANLKLTAGESANANATGENAQISDRAWRGEVRIDDSFWHFPTSQNDHVTELNGEHNLYFRLPHEVQGKTAVLIAHFEGKGDPVTALTTLTPDNQAINLLRYNTRSWGDKGAVLNQAISLQAGQFDRINIAIHLADHLQNPHADYPDVTANANVTEQVDDEVIIEDLLSM